LKNAMVYATVNSRVNGCRACGYDFNELDEPYFMDFWGDFHKKFDIDKFSQKQVEKYLKEFVNYFVLAYYPIRFDPFNDSMEMALAGRMK
jgi:hypothetical protein